ncbi:hypothetical protein GCM10010140_21900 [Streptosporangium pseudovulgare]|uniref:Uncharacterized protein n=1 Tax=Streptosporangium pseudovulgare TaxID=35765 RepID=A0ABQ2QSR8_9ACTN|nr:hypothetical protein GCM10010140_21900 [Streptosporangium pseudovulgare]
MERDALVREERGDAVVPLERDALVRGERGDAVVPVECVAIAHPRWDCTDEPPGARLITG